MRMEEKAVDILMCNVHCAISNVQCAMCNVQCVLCNVQCTMCNVKCAMCNVQNEQFAQSAGLFFGLDQVSEVGQVKY